jgi:hypothetical protein
MPPMQPVQPPQPVVPGPDPKPRSGGRALLTHGLVAVIALAIGAAAGGGKSNTATTSAAPAPAVTVTVTAKAAAPQTTQGAQGSSAAGSGAATTVAGDGEYRVGQDMQPGTYRTAGPSDASGGTCYWERDRDSSGSMDSILANDNLAGSGLVTVTKGEIFKSTGCQSWVKTG